MTLLKGRSNLCALSLSSDEKYVQGCVGNGKVTIWDVETGVEADIDLHQHTVDWDKQCFIDGYLVDEADSHLVVCGHPYSPLLGWRLGIMIDKYHKNTPVVLFKRPTLASFLCQQAFLNSQHDETELVKLRDSQAVANIKGFPRYNLLNLIDKTLKKMK